MYVCMCIVRQWIAQVLNWESEHLLINRTALGYVFFVLRIHFICVCLCLCLSTVRFFCLCCQIVYILLFSLHLSNFFSALSLASFNRKNIVNIFCLVWVDVVLASHFCAVKMLPFASSCERWTYLWFSGPFDRQQIDSLSYLVQYSNIHP